MSAPVRAIRRFTVRTVLPAPLAPLGELASNLRWSWHKPTRDLFESMDPTAWVAVHREPGALLGALSTERLEVLAADPRFVERVHAAAADLRTYLQRPGWYAGLGDDAPASVAYFSMEFGITGALPQYSGGLGILAGDHLKSASDLAVPIVGVGLFYATGYFKQSLSRDGWQQETYPVLDPDGLPLSLLREADGTAAKVSLDLPGGRRLWAQVWKAQVGRVPLLLLDSDVEENDDAARGVTDRLYGGGGEHRLQQELLCGIGGVRALRTWSRLTGAPEPEVYHTNEGHAGFLSVERIREHVERGLTFDEALEAVRAATVFTTHTPVPAGIDRFGRDQIELYFGAGNPLPGVPLDRVLALGAEDYEGGDPGVFNMAVMGLRLAQRANGVSQLHGAVSRGMFDGLWPGFDAPEVPIASITNGVHAPTWVAPEVITMGKQYIGPELPREGLGFEKVGQVPDEEIWRTRRLLRARLVEDARRRLKLSWLQRGASEAELAWTKDVLDPDVLTIGFARRVPTYKRLTLMLRDPERLRSMLLHPQRPVQLVIAGKSHPADETGKRLIQQMVRFADDPAVRHRIVFLPNYDITMALTLYPGCDVWLNNPLRPFEACGTSGMKAALNGGLNLSILDGWWDEWYDGGNGWAIPTADGVDDPEHRDDLEAAALYDLVENSVAARFYDRDERGLPARWLEMVRHTLASLGPKVLASRMVTDYVEQLYVPAARAGRAALASSAAAARDLARWKAAVRSGWAEVRVEHVESAGVGDSAQIGDVVHVRANVSLGELSVDDVEVQVVHGRVSESDELRPSGTVPLHHGEALGGGRHRFEGEFALRQTGPFGYTVRVLPRHPGLAGPAELGLVANA
ncbi:alpha-glucan phosphorylase [Kineococcus radiotolerans SRS30216 = ATCC BAA-149]|uniref:glycogen phosphorylase n=1 Tax=Kineococcus radiotolerans (strain ATCC BAA-149 / DSM 14245 / SRS30216) TaxID=266940 RepID=A6W7J7_KINRD|nr:alpha-glucan phosphorylase [Kineococcus radiotolerans SRS30216 = ATCC BAA-149]